MNLKTWAHRDGKYLNDHAFASGATAPIVQVSSMHALNQLVGYVKYSYRDKMRVYFRGQENIYNAMTASIFRGIRSNTGIAGRNNAISKYIKECSKKMSAVQSLPDYATEPLLQHYGIKTRWLDLVDNVWVALWFGMHSYKSKLHDRHYEFVEIRTDKLGFQYLLLIGSDALSEKSGSPGLFQGSKTLLVDLRIATPSIFLRPHSQHAILLKSKTCDTVAEVDLSDHVIAIVKVTIRDAIDWLGFGRLISAENIYPSPVFDQGYGLLLEQAPHDRAKAPL